MKVHELQDRIKHLNPNEEIAVELYTELDIRENAANAQVDLDDEQVKAVIQAIDDRNDQSDEVIEYYLDLLVKGELDE